MQLDKLKMPSSEAKPLLTAPQTEKPRHYKYLKEFRVDQCPLFLQHKCTQHRPFTCFNWHFMNQRRRRPVRKRDGSFNYSADNYCPKYDETTGICPDGDECPFLHRTAGDTERRYHLRYYKTCTCVHETDNRGYCAKNGAHCAFAHGPDDQRMPVYDIKEIQAIENPDGDTVPNGPNVLDKERNLMNEDPKWQDTNYVLAYYKTEQCKRPPRLCRQGYACPQYHNSRDKRRPPRKNKYRSTPCPNVKHGDEWGEPTNCENGDNCSYCHTRTEQQFHPEIYKSTKCNDVQSAGYCPRGAFCAFAHVDQEMTTARELSGPLDLNTSLADLLHNAVPANRKRNKKSSESSNGSGELSECTSTSSVGSNGSHSKAPGAQLAHRNDNHHQLSSAFMNDSYQERLRDTILPPLDNVSLLGDSDKDKSQNLYVGINMGNNSLRGLQYDLEVMGNALDDLHLDDQNLGILGIDREFESDSPTISNSISAGILGSSAPVNIPRSSHSNFSPGASPLQHLQSGFLSANRFSHPDTLESSFLNHVSGNHVNNSGSRLGSLTNSGLYGGDFGMSPSSRPSVIGTGFTVSPSLVAPSSSLSDPIGRKLSEKSKGCENCYHLVDEATRKAIIAEQQRDEATAQAQALQKEVDLLQGSPYLHGLRRVSELKSLSLATLKSLQAQLRKDLEQVDKEVRLQMDPKCLVCNERNRAVTVGPCNHYVLCMSCAPAQKDCPYCLSQIVAHTTPTINSALQM